MHLKQDTSLVQTFTPSDYFLIILVDAPRLDYASFPRFLRTWTKHPRNLNKDCSYGHVWIMLHGKIEDNHILFEGGHSGELDTTYAEGVFHLIEEGDKNPIRYLWEPLNDGFLQIGSGGHTPSIAAKVNLTKEQFLSIYHFINPINYPYQSYSLRKRQCVSFAIQVAALADWDLDGDITLKIPKYLYEGKKKLELWDDPIYSELTFASPDMLEKCLLNAEINHYAEDALTWYLTHFHREKENKSNLSVFSKRLSRHLKMRRVKCSG